MFHRRDPNIIHVGPNLFCMAIGMAVLVMTLNPILALITYFACLLTFLHFAEKRK